jgi:hypothetical protein
VPEGTGITEEWIPITSQEKPYSWYQLDDEPRMVSTLKDRMNFWNVFALEELYVPVPVPGATRGRSVAFSQTRLGEIMNMAAK